MPPKKEKRLDVAKLQKMQEPITVQVYRVKQGNKIPIKLPSKTDGPPGTGWARDDVLQLHDWVLNNTGGGFYEAEATDANGTSMVWPFGWDPRVFPEKVPTDWQGHVSQPTPAAAMPPQPGQPIPMPPNPMAATSALGSSNSSWLSGPQGFYPYQQGPQQQAYPQQPGYPQPHGYPQQSSFSYMPFGFSQGSKSASDRERDLEQRLRQQELSNAQAQYQQQIDRLQMQHTTELSKLREELRRATESKPAVESERVRELEARLEAERQERQREQQMKMLQENTQRQIDALKELIVKATENKGESAELREMKEQQRRMEEKLERERAEQRHQEQLRALESKINSGPDPMLEYLKENSRQQLEAQKEQVRNQREITQMTTGMMVNPMQMMEMMQRQSGQSDAVTKQLIDNFGAGFETYRMMMESLMQMQGGGQSPGMAMLSEGLQRAGEIANQYIAAQRDRAVHEARAKAQSAAAQVKTAEAYQRQASARPPSYDEEMKTPSSGLGDAAPANGAAPSNGANGEAKPPPEAEVIDLDERRAPSEEEMFGHPEVLTAVKHLREGVANEDLDPQGAVNALLQGIAVCEQRQMIVPAFTLFAEGRFADLMDALLPKASQQFRDTCVQILAEQFLDEAPDDYGGDDDSPQPTPPA